MQKVKPSLNTNQIQVVRQSVRQKPAKKMAVAGFEPALEQ